MSGYRLVSVERTRVGRVKVVHLTGEVDRLNVPDLDGFLAEIAAGTDDVVVGLGGVTYLDLGGVAFIERLADAAQTAGRAFVLAEVPAAIQRILQILELDRTLTMVPTIRDALTHLGLDAVSPDRPVAEPAPSLLRDPQE